jgi:glycosyltransferase involved in cell wall biosynthesis
MNSPQSSVASAPPVPVPQTQPYVVAVVPAFNEERFIASVVLKTRDYANQVIVVDDGSSDRTAELARQAGAYVVQLGQNQGKAGALNAGFNVALRFKPTVIVCLDADAQHDPSEIPQVIQPVVSDEADVVIGSRFLEKKSAIPGWRKVGQHTLTAVTNLTSGLKISDSQSGYRAFSPGAVAILKFRTGGLSVESEMQFLLEDAGLRVTEVPISVMYQDGNKRNPIVHGLHVLDAILSLAARRRPLAFFSLPGVVLGFIGLMFGARVYLHMQQSKELLIGTALLTTLFIIGGILLGISGVLLHTFEHLVRRLREEMYYALKQN